MTYCQPLGVLPYASPDVRTSPPRTALRMSLAVVRWVLGQLLIVLRYAILAVGYGVLGVSVVVRLALGLVAMMFLYVGGLRWELVKARTLRAAQWVDVKMLRAMRFLRREVVAERARWPQ